MTSSTTLMHRMSSVVQEASMAARRDFNDHATSLSCGLSEKSKRSGFPDYVTRTDKKIEDIMRIGLSKSCPDIPFVGEECGGDCNQEQFFLVDPLDGTSNFVALRDYFAICAAYIKDGEVRAAVIADPMRNVLVKAVKDEGAYLQTSYGTSRKLDLAALPAGDDLRHVQLECEMPLNDIGDMVRIMPLLETMSGFRKSGSTALDLLNLVCGRNIVCLSSHLAPFDIAAGLLIVQEAGGVITDMNGDGAAYTTDNILAARPSQHAQALRLLKR